MTGSVAGPMWALVWSRWACGTKDIPPPPPPLPDKEEFPPPVPVTTGSDLIL